MALVKREPTQKLSKFMVVIAAAELRYKKGSSKKSGTIRKMKEKVWK